MDGEKLEPVGIIGQEAYRCPKCKFVQVLRNGCVPGTSVPLGAPAIFIYKDKNAAAGHCPEAFQQNLFAQKTLF
jgi:hypothetical protein